MTLSYSHGREFTRQIRPILERQDTEALLGRLSRWWPNEMLRAVLTCGCDDAAKTALVCLSLTGTMADTADIASLLHHDDPATAALAERALWSIWFRAGDDRANTSITQAVHLISENLLDKALDLLDGLVARCPTFAEAYNQLAIVHFLKGDYHRAIENCQEALRLNGHHFGAMAGLGHGYASLGKWKRALEAYCGSLQLHPRLEGIRQSIQQIRKGLDRVGSSSNSPSSTS